MFGIEKGNQEATREILGWRLSNEVWGETSQYAPVELELTLYVNQQEWLNILCTPSKLDYLVTGFLYGQGIITGLDDIKEVCYCKEDADVYVELKDSDFVLPHLRTLTSGAGGSIFETRGQKVRTDFAVDYLDILSLLKAFQDQMDLYWVSGGVHSSALANKQELVLMAEDIGRHNTLDKIIGQCLVEKIMTKDLILLTTGRISSEMLLKTAKMQVPIVVSRHSPTAKAVSMAADLGITLVGRAKGGILMVYTYPDRLGCVKGVKLA